MGFYDDIVSDAVAPPWLQQGAYQLGPGVGGRYLQTIGIELDTLFQRAKYAAYNGLPTVCDPTALAFIGLDRVIVRGPSESDASYRARLAGAFDAWQHAGSAWGVLQQVLGLFVGFSGGLPPARTVGGFSTGPSRTWDCYGAAANMNIPPTSVLALVNNWNWDGEVEWTGLGPGVTPWWRYWLIVDNFGGSAWDTGEGNWGDPGNWGDNMASWGLSNPPSLFASMRSVVRSWQAANGWCRWIVVNSSSGAYSQDTTSPSEPDGHWGFWGKTVSGVRVQARDTTARYVDGVATGQ